MGKDEQGFMDQLVEDIANAIELKGVVEASRDENGKVDKWKATGMAMGLGHTSDEELTTLAGFLGAEGAFDEDTDDGTDDFDDIPIISPVSTTSRTDTMCDMSEAEYENRKQSTHSNASSSLLVIGALAYFVFSKLAYLPESAL